MWRSTSLLRYFSSPKIWRPLLLAIVLLVSLTTLLLSWLSAGMQVPCSKEDLTGTIQTIAPGSETGSTTIGLAAQGQTRGGVDMRFSVRSFVHVYVQQGKVCQTVQRRSVGDLRIGQTVKAWSSSGITLLSYPGWLEDVTDVVILA
ncbi:MAG TPA: hypothetical protein VGF67_17695 [Ktedonobacteraceae bacterium]|jgi:hypothetical protein